MADKYQETPKRPEMVRVPPQRGRVKAMIFKGFAQKVKNVVSLVGFAKRGAGNGSLASTRLPVVFHLIYKYAFMSFSFLFYSRQPGNCKTGSGFRVDGNSKDNGRRQNTSF
ncbi:hypothetical protein SADUNF_Sadunf10G0167400 [Salix dunnii]|uniref:Uncharacterized protein n=1 Tax=Salix dunnii TaxID=1413687 RepID=A0A835MQ59_9ROSI|nr:hypothetical protein SADUNF_Sadunf10G0167400 [Salix dunnii]